MFRCMTQSHAWSWQDRQLDSWNQSPAASSYSLVTSTSLTSGLRHRSSGSESDLDSVLDGVRCDTCMDIVIMMSRTALVAGDRFHMEKTQDHTAVDLSIWKNAGWYRCWSFYVKKTQDHFALDLSMWKNTGHHILPFHVEKHRIIPPLVLLPMTSLLLCRGSPTLWMTWRKRTTH